MTAKVIWNGFFLRHGIVWIFLFLFLVHQAFFCCLLGQKGAQRRQNKSQSWNLTLSSLPKAESLPSCSQGPSPASRSLSTCLEGLLLVVSLISPPYTARLLHNWYFVTDWIRRQLLPTTEAQNVINGLNRRPGLWACTLCCFSRQTYVFLGIQEIISAL